MVMADTSREFQEENEITKFGIFTVLFLFIIMALEAMENMFGVVAVWE